MCIKDMRLSTQNMITRLNSQQNWGGPIQPSNEHENLHYDSEYDIHIVSEIHKESGHGHYFDLLAILN